MRTVESKGTSTIHLQDGGLPVLPERGWDWQASWNQQLPVRRQLFFHHWIAGGYSEREIRDRCRQLHIPLDDLDKYIVAMLEPSWQTGVEAQWADDRGIMLRFMFHGMLRDWLEAAASGWYLFQDARDVSVIIFGSRKEEEEGRLYARVSAVMASAVNYMQSQGDWGVASGIGTCVRHPDKVVLSYQQALCAMEEQRGRCERMLASLGDVSGTDLFAENDLVKSLKIALETGNGDKAEKVYQEILNGGLLKASGVNSIKENILLLSSLFVRMIHLQGWTVKEIVKEDYPFFHRLDSLHSKEQAVALFHRTVRNMIAHVHKQRMSNTKQLIGEILEFVDKEVTKGLSLQMVADLFFINPSYLSRIFKQETGRVFSDYLLERKMEKGRNLLQEGMKVYDVAGLLGYADISYFIRVFHKHWGVTPGELKR